MSSLISPIAIAPMVDWTYTYFRVLMRLIAPQSLLYTEMQTVGALLNNPARAFCFNSLEQPLALQLGGSDKNKLVACAKLAEERGFQEINLNLGCPSDKVQAGRFGACLMKEEAHVASCIAAIKQAISLPLSAKTRIGVDHEDSYEFFSSFVKALVAAGCDKLIVHARKAWLRGLSPKQNRSIPPLNYDFVYQIKKEIPNIPVVINGNIQSLEEIKQHLLFVDGVMLGRLACQNPYALAFIHHAHYPHIPISSRQEIIEKYVSYILLPARESIPLSILLKPIFNFAHGLPQAKHWKEKLLLIQKTKDLQALQILGNCMAEMESYVK